MPRILQGTALLLVFVLAICLGNLLRLPRAPEPVPAAAPIYLDGEVLAQRLAAALRIRTISYEESREPDTAAFDALAAHLQVSFPKLHANLQREYVGPSLLYTWAGRDAQAQPILLLAHMDVVPVEPGTESRWTHPPFEGVVADGYVWGRGARDDKSGVLGLMEAVEFLLAQGFAPSRTIYFAFGHDEEVGGQNGAKQIAALLKARGVHAEFLLDEGGAVLTGIVPGVAKPVAAIMSAEKGYVSFRLTARAEGGHSSRPPKQTAVGRLARAVARVQAQPLDARLEPPVSDMLDRLAPEMPFEQRLAIANRWLFRPLILRFLSRAPETDALIRTTTAPTVFHAGIKDNVLPAEAYALINFRLLPGDTLDDLMQHLRATIADDQIEISEYGSFGTEASEPSAIDGPAFQVLERTVHEVFPEAVVSTGLVIGATDARNYEGVFENRYNFSPLPLTKEDLARIHGTDERIGVDDYARMVQFYVQLLRNTAG